MEKRTELNRYGLRHPLTEAAAGLLLYFTLNAFLGRFWDRIAAESSVSFTSYWASLGLRTALLLFAMMVFIGMTGYARIFTMKTVSFAKALIPGSYMILASLVSILSALASSNDFLDPVSLVPFLVYFLLLAAAEELIFRGIVSYGLLRAMVLIKETGHSSEGAKTRPSLEDAGSLPEKTISPLGILFSVFISGMIFSLAHLQNLVYADMKGVLIQMAGALLMGMLLTAVYYCSFNIYAVIFLHAVHDIAAALPLLSPANNEDLSDLVSSYGVSELLYLLPYGIVLILILRFLTSGRALKHQD